MTASCLHDAVGVKSRKNGELTSMPLIVLESEPGVVLLCVIMGLVAVSLAVLTPVPAEKFTGELLAGEMSGAGTGTSVGTGRSTGTSVGEASGTGNGNVTEAGR